MKKNKFLAMMLAVGMAASLIACGNSGSSESNAEGQTKKMEQSEAENTDDLPVLRVATMPFITSLPTEGGL